MNCPNCDHQKLFPYSETHSETGYSKRYICRRCKTTVVEVFSRGTNERSRLEMPKDDRPWVKGS